jgi:hypothetical protein
LLLSNIGDAEVSVGELTLRGCYLGSNVPYNKAAHRNARRTTADQFMSDCDREGPKLRDRMETMHQRHLAMLNLTAITHEELHETTATLRRLESFWVRAGHQDRRSYRARSVRRARSFRLILDDVGKVVEDQQVVLVELGDANSRGRAPP